MALVWCARTGGNLLDGRDAGAERGRETISVRLFLSRGSPFLGGGQFFAPRRVCVPVPVWWHVPHQSDLPHNSSRLLPRVQKGADRKHGSSQFNGKKTCQGLGRSTSPVEHRGDGSQPIADHRQSRKRGGWAASTCHHPSLLLLGSKTMIFRSNVSSLASSIGWELLQIIFADGGRWRWASWLSTKPASS